MITNKLSARFNEICPEDRKEAINLVRFRSGVAPELVFQERIGIRDAFPDIFNRSYTALERTAEARLAMLLLSFHDIDALSLEFGKIATRKRFAVSGYSCLSKLLRTDPREYARFLHQPCQEISIELATVLTTQDIQKLLQVFDEEQFGFASVVDRMSDPVAFVSLRDFLGLYEKSILKTELAVGDVASFPLFSLPSETTLRNTLSAMFEHDMRRVFISGTRAIVSDRAIIDHVFSTSKLEEMSEGPSAVLDAKLSDVKSVEPKMISANADINSAARALYTNKDGCLMCEKGIITAWDLVMKPWKRNKNTVRSHC